MIASHRPTSQIDDNTAYWVTVARRLLQRGTMPLVPRADSISWPRVIGPDVVEALFAPRASDVDPDLRLDERYEHRFFADVRARFPSEAVFLFPQAPFESLGAPDGGTSTQWVDFFYAPPRGSHTVLEIDGDHRSVTAVDRRRDKALSARGIRTVRVAPTNGKLDPTPLFDTLRASPVQFPAAGHPDVRATIDAVRLCYGLIEAVAVGALTSADVWRIDAQADSLDGDHLGLALDSMAALDAIWSTGVLPGLIEIRGGPPLTWRNPFATAKRGSESEASVRVEWGPTWTDPFSDPTADVIIRGVPLPSHPGWDSPLSIERRSLSKLASERPDVDAALAVLANYAFGIAEFRSGQLRALRRLLTGGDALVLLPTGHGKTLIYQVGMLLRPGTTLVVAPIKSLIDDQERRFTDEGMDRVAAIHSGRVLDATSRHILHRSLAEGNAHVALISPERLQIARFREALDEAATTGLVNLAVIDEAHCVSEWGHDFRTSYLRLARSLRRFGSDAHGVTPPILALTGTASPAVLRDVLDELGIDDVEPEALQRPDGFDRTNLHFEVIRGTDAETFMMLDQAVRVSVPEALHIDPQALTELNHEKTECGIVFVPHAGGKYGVGKVRDQLLAGFEAAELPRPAVGEYSGTMTDASRVAVAADFRCNNLNILVATKAFGMGIDKPNIRWTVHVGLPSSIEGFVQEAGRAGRDNDRAQCIVVSGRPDDEVIQRHLDASIAPRERRSEFAKRSRDLGDVGRQLFFLYGSFPGAKFNDERTDLAEAIRTAWSVGEALQAQEVFSSIMSRGGCPGAHITIPRVPESITEYLRTHPDLGDKQRSLVIEGVRQLVDKALHRIAIVGVIDDLTIDYGADTVSLDLAYYDARHVDRATLAFANQILPGKYTDHVAALDAAPIELKERVDHHLRYVVSLIYRVIEPARLNALLEMWRLTLNSPTDETIRGTIASYLGGGPTSILLADLVKATTINVPDALERLESTARGDEYDWAGAAARLLEAYPGHPVLLFVRAGGEAYLPQGTIDGFGQQVGGLTRALDEYSIDDEGRSALFRRLNEILRNARQGSRAQWAKTLWARWYETSGPTLALNDAADRAMSTPTMASTSELEAALTYRLKLIRDLLPLPRELSETRI